VPAEQRATSWHAHTHTHTHTQWTWTATCELRVGAHLISVVVLPGVVISVSSVGARPPRRMHQDLRAHTCKNTHFSPFGSPSMEGGVNPLLQRVVKWVGSASRSSATGCRGCVCMHAWVHGCSQVSPAHHQRPTHLHLERRAGVRHAERVAAVAARHFFHLVGTPIFLTKESPTRSARLEDDVMSSRGMRTGVVVNERGISELPPLPHDTCIARNTELERGRRGSYSSTQSCALQI
jgi:hypothetical protein